MTPHPGQQRRLTQGLYRAALVVVSLGIVGACANGAVSLISKGIYRDFEQYYWAAAAMRAGADLYSGRSDGYVYPPLTAFGLMPLAAWPLKSTALAWLAVNLSLLVAAAWLAACEGVRAAGLRVSAWVTLGVAVGGTLIVADKARGCIQQGQTDLVTVLAFVLGLRWLGRGGWGGRDWAAGCVLGIAANIKYASLAVLPYLLVRRRWRAAGWMVAWIVALALLPAVHRGWERNLGDLGVALGRLSQIGRADAARGQLSPVARHRCVSIPGAVTRWTGGEKEGEPGRTDGAGGRRARVAVIVAGIAVAVALIAAGIYWRRGIPLWRPYRDSAAPMAARVIALEWSGLIVAVLAFSPHTEGRHMVMLLPVTCLAVALIAAERSAAQRVPLAVGLLFLWLGLTLPPGGDRFRGAVDAWRAAAGMSWCMILMYFTALWTGLARPGEERGRAAS